ncbi:SRPBCC family protein [Conexibacter woesei]|uniref:Activator of Hsp90 ATPase 1 family protein n=1 Tax=Conexibacter woesei (strain DSM 14684 / CCUG 47730 / CIP 108061 / JCM 11494 / NBRC 100937 / ID131577) TaxID=469383 RepID=D3F2W2_CONWI|nr:SRPBCC domain-containing protein [Conexibacter woesei]ADB54243.1 Activator of Hsp90 ATPase 1 family protein [Conexibacter woesei DSM 14684]
MTAEPAAAVHRAVVLPVSRERAWEAVTDPAQLACWLADEVELDAREGGAATFAWEDGTTRVGVVDELAEQRRIAFRWHDEELEESLVELTLDDVEGGTRVSVVEVRTRVLRAGDVPLAPAGAPTAWTQRMAALSACSVAVWA